MDLTIPIYNEIVKGPAKSEPVHRVFALFSVGVSAQDASLRKATNRMVSRLSQLLNTKGRSWSHYDLAALAFNPELDQRRLKLTLELKHRVAKTTLLFVSFPLVGRFIAFAPRYPELWFEISDTHDLEKRATAVFEEHFRALEKEEENYITPESISNPREAWISWVDVSVRTDPPSEAEVEKNLLAMFGSGAVDGAEELQRVGHCLDQWYPEDLDRALFREAQIAEIEKILAHPVRRAILLVGPHSVGKTCLVHEIVYRHAATAQKSAKKLKSNFWWISPQRLISGMMYVGQWENRLLAILKESKKRNHVLYFDDVLTMFRAGQSRDSKLCVADLMKNALSSRSVRVIAEMTAEAFQVLSSRDRGFADLFHMVHVRPTSSEQTQRIAISTIQSLELKHRCAFEFDVLPTAEKFSHFNARTEAMPGQIVRVLREMALRHQNRAIQPYQALIYFRSSSGLSWLLLNRNNSMPFEELSSNLKSLVVGQRRALDVLAHAISVARANLNETNRPLASLLFLGPTGVGKTETAKAAAKIMFDSAEHLVRFDLNQFKTAYAASTLVGTLDEPEGLLTSAVRQRPHCVLLLDEVEKAHPDVLDILLQVLGEARLTDSLGRTTDFSNCLIILTSNLGTQRGNQKIGFSEGESSDHYINAAKKFFRPEFFNRIDEIVPFTELKPDEIRKIAQRLIESIVNRQGLLRRNCILKVEPSAVEATVELGYHPDLGARAMKRVLEVRLASPVAESLAEMPVEATTIVRVHAGLKSGASNQSLSVSVSRLERARITREQRISLGQNAEVERATKFLQRIENIGRPKRPEGGIGVSELTAAHLRYFAFDEQVRRIREFVNELKIAAQEKRKSGDSSVASITARKSGRDRENERTFHRIKSTVDDAKEFFQSNDTIRQPGDVAIERIINECSLLDAMSKADERDTSFVFVRSIQPLNHNEALLRMFRLLASEIQQLFLDASFEIVPPTDDFANWTQPRLVMKISGPYVGVFVNGIVGSYEVTLKSGQLGLFQVGEIPAVCFEPLFGKGDSRFSAKELAKIKLEMVSQLEDFESDGFGDISLSEDPFRIRPVVQLIVESQNRIDLRSQKTFKCSPDSKSWYEAILSGLPLVEEFSSDEGKHNA